MDDAREFVPALGRAELTGGYDRVVAVMTRERRWRAELLDRIAPAAGETIIDIGCGTGTFAIMLKKACPDARIVGIDPDPQILEIARAKATAACVEVEWAQHMGDELGMAIADNGADKATSSLVLHQCPMEMKRAILASMFSVLRGGGGLFIADYGHQRSLLMRMLFRQVQQLDGYENTQPNADGVLPVLFEEAGFTQISEVKIVPTPTGSISIFTAQKRGQDL